MNLPVHPPRKSRVLIVDDDPALRLLMREVLLDLDLTIDEAVDGAEALEQYRRQPADLVLLDVDMPRMDGFSACAELHKLPCSNRTTVVMVTGMDDHESISRAYELGATDFITKPINWTILPERVRFLLRAQEAFQALRENEARLNEAQRIASLGYWEWNLDDDKLIWSDQVYRIFGRDSLQCAIDFDGFMQQVHPDDRRLVREAVREAMESDAPYSIDHRILRPNGEERIVHEQAELQRAPDNRPLRMLGTVHDITERTLAEQRIHHLAYYDNLTGLPNRHLFREFAEHAIPAARRQDQKLALLHLDIDRFSRINDTLGHDAGDLLLRSIAKRLLRCVRGSDFVSNGSGEDAMDYSLARLGADEFLVLLTGLEHPESAAVVAQRLLEGLSEPLHAAQGEYILTASLGIALYPDDAGDLDTLLRYADTSLHHVKRAGGNRFRFYSSDMDDRSHRRLGLETHLHRALEREEFELHYQPQVNSGDRRMVGMEALLRWRRPDEGLIPPGDFIPLAEETGLIVPIGEWVIHEACRQIAEWRQQGRQTVPVAINLSARQFAEATLMQTIARALADNRLNPALLELELTESMIMRDAEDAARKLWAFHETGLRIAVDDFGTGYSSMSYLKRFPLDVLKIDQSFVRDLADNSTDAAIARAIIALGRALDLTTLAEGVETPEQLDILSQSGCDLIQGFLTGRPVPANRIYSTITDKPTSNQPIPDTRSTMP